MQRAGVAAIATGVVALDGAAGHAEVEPLALLTFLGEGLVVGLVVPDCFDATFHQFRHSQSHEVSELQLRLGLATVAWVNIAVFLHQEVVRTTIDLAGAVIVGEFLEPLVVNGPLKLGASEMLLQSVQELHHLRLAQLGFEMAVGAVIGKHDVEICAHVEAVGIQPFDIRDELIDASEVLGAHHAADSLAVGVGGQRQHVIARALEGGLALLGDAQFLVQRKR